MTRLRWASGISLVALPRRAAGWGRDDSPESAGPGGHVVYAEQFTAAAGWALETNDATR